MDETETTQQDNSSAVSDGSTQEETPTLTESQVKVREAKARNDALSEIGRLEKAMQGYKSIAEGTLARLKEKEAADLAREEEALQGDPDKVSAFRIKQAGIKAKADAEEILRKVEEKEALIQTRAQKFIGSTARELAGKYNVTVETLLKYGGDSDEALQELAMSYGERQGGTARVTEAPDSGKTKGAGKGLTKEDLNKMSPEEQHERRDEIAKLSF